MGFKAYIASCGLQAEDIPKAIAVFMTAKYSTWAFSVLLGVRCQPLRRLFLAKHEVMPAGGAAQGWSNQTTKWLIEEWGRTRRQVPSPVKWGGSRSTAARFDEAWAAAKSQYRTAKARCRDTKGRWSAGAFLLAQHILRAQKQMPQNIVTQQATWHAWTSARYWQLSDKLEKAAAKNIIWTSVSTTFKLDPKGLARGLAEGTILYKFTFPLHAPLLLWITVTFFRQRSVLRAETFPEVAELEAVPSEEDPFVE